MLFEQTSSRPVLREKPRGLVNEAALPGSEIELARDLDAALYGPGYRARVGVDLEHPFYRCAILLLGGEVESGGNPPDDEDLLLGLYLPHGVGVEAVEGNLTRYQRAPKGAEQSATRCGHQVV